LITPSDTGKVSVVDSLGSRIHRIEGNFLSVLSLTWNGGSQNVSADPTITNKYIFDFKDATLVSNFKLRFNIGKWCSSTKDSTESLSTVDNVTIQSMKSSTSQVPHSLRNYSSSLEIIGRNG